MPWITTASNTWKLYTCRKSDNYEFVIDSKFTNPKFMIFWNGLRFNGSISGLSPRITPINATRFRINPLIYTPYQLRRFFGGSAPYTMTVGAIPYMKKVELSGYLYPVASVGAMNGRVDLTVLNPANGATIQSFTGVNMIGSQYMGSYWWSYLVPDAHYNNGVTVRYTITRTRGLVANDACMINQYTDGGIVENGDGSITMSGFNMRPVDDATFTILVVQGS